MKILNEAASVSLRVDGDHAYLEHALAYMGIPSTRQNEEYSMTVSLNAIRLIAGSDWSPQEVRFAHELPRRTAEHLESSARRLCSDVKRMRWLPRVSLLIGRCPLRINGFIES